MPNPTMPAGFVPTVATYSQGDPGGVLRTEVAGGPARYCLDYDRGQQTYDITLALDVGQFSIWVIFWTHSIKKGALAFDMRLDTGLGPATHTVRLLPGSYSATHQGGAVSVQFSVECQSAVYALSDAAVAAYNLSATRLPTGMVPRVVNYSQTGPEGVLREDVPGGVAAYGLDWGRGLQRFACSLVLTAAQFAIWSVWYHRLIKKGAYTFTMPLDSGLGPADHSANIVPGSYSATRIGGRHTAVSFVVEAEPATYGLSAADIATYYELHAALGADVDDVLARIARFANTDTLVLNI